MKRLSLSLVVILLSILTLSGVALAQSTPEFKLGFKTLADQLPADVVGTPTENEHFNLSNGNSEQHTTKGLMVWRKADNWTAYTNGYMTWINGPNGVQSRLNTDRFDWEKDAPAAAETPATPTSTLAAVAPPASPPAPSAPPIFQATFDSPDSKWDADNTASVNANVVDGQFRVLSKSSSGGYGKAVAEVKVPNFELSADVRFVNAGASSAALIFNRSSQDHLSDWYAFEIWRDGKYSVYATFGQQPTVILAAGTAPMVSQDGMNHLKVRRQGSLIAVYINDQLVKAVSDDRLKGTWVGFATWLSNDTGEVRLDNFTVIPIPDGSPTVSPSATADQSAQRGSYDPVVRVMDDKSGGPAIAVNALMSQVTQEWANSWGWKPSKPTTIYLYSSGLQMADREAANEGRVYTDRDKLVVALLTVGSTERDVETGGYAIVMNTSSYQDGTPTWEVETKAALLHEYTHVMQIDVAGYASPEWFMEGMADTIAFAKFPQARNATYDAYLVGRAKAQGKLPTLRQLQNNWADISPDVAYAASHMAVKYLAGKVGGMPLLQVLQKTAAGQDFESALSSVTGYTLDRLDSEYRAAIP